MIWFRIVLISFIALWLVALFACSTMAQEPQVTNLSLSRQAKPDVILPSRRGWLIHEYYSDACCAGQHCHPVPCEEITSTPDGGWKWKDRTFDHHMLRLAPDGRCSVCIAAAPVCIYLPPRV